MKKRAFAAATIIALLGLLISACGAAPPDPAATPLSRTPALTPPPSLATPIPDSIVPKYASPVGGLSIWYPEDWIYEEQEEGVIFASSEGLISGDEVTSGAAMTVYWLDWEETWELEVSSLVWAAILNSPLSRGKPEDFHEQPGIIGRQDGHIVSFEGTFEEDGVPITGFVGGVEHEGRGFVFWATSALDEWTEHGPDLKGMLDSVQFTVPATPSPTVISRISTPVTAISPENADQVTELARWGEGTLSVESLAFSPDGQTLASGGGYGDNTLRLWRVSDGELLRTLEGHTGSVESVAFSPDGQTLASGSADNTVRLWRANDGGFLETLEDHTEAVYGVVFSPDGQTLASVSGDWTVRLWGVSDGQLLKTLTGDAPLESVAFSPDGQTLASGSLDDTVRLWQVADGALLQTLEVDPGQLRAGVGLVVNSVAFSPDWRKLASGSSGGVVHLWRMNDGALLETLEGHTGSVNGLTFSPDGQILASVSGDWTVRLWGVSDGELLKTLTGDAPLESVAFSPGGQIVASGSWDGTILLWGIPGE